MTKYVLAEHLKEEIRGRRILAAVFHTFNFDSEFFENYLLPLFLPDIPFGDNKIQNTILWKKFQEDLPPVTVYCDFHAKAEKGIHLDYLVRPIDVPKQKGFKPCYHVKHSFILLEDWELIVITGSNNLTEAGWCSNLEGVNFFKLKSKVNYPRHFKDQFKFFNRYVRGHFYQDDFRNDNTLSEADVLIERFFKAQGYTKNISTEYYDTIPDYGFHSFKSYIQDIKERLNNNETFEKVEVLSPYFPKGISLFKTLKEVTECDDISFSIPFENTDVVALDEKLFDEAIEEGIEWKIIKSLNETKGYRFSHAKIYQFVGREKVFIVVGSINFTNMAWKGTKNGGNFESAIMYSHPKEKFTSLLMPYSYDHLTFTGYKEEEKIKDNREDAYKLDFMLDWDTKTLDINNLDEDKQRGVVVFDNLPSISINKTRVARLNEAQITSLSNNPIIKVKPVNKNTYFYYYPIHRNIESKPLPEHLNLNDSELLQLWMDLDSKDNKAVVLQIIDRFIDRITDEAGDIKDKELNTTHSTLNVMATHLSGLLKLQKKIFSIAVSKKQYAANLKMRDYYLFANNVDTISGYRSLISKMSKDGKLNDGFYWLLLNCIDLFFYKSLKPIDFENHESYSKIERIRKILNKEIKELQAQIVNEQLTEKHLKWTLKMLKYDIK